MIEYAPFGPTSQLLGIWIAAFVTLALYSFLYEDNPVYKFAEHLFVGVSAGYFIARSSRDVIHKKCLELLMTEPGYGEARDWFLIVPLILGLMVLFKILPRQGWIARWPLSFMVGTGIGLQIISYLQSNCIAQVAATIKPFKGFEQVLDASGVVLLKFLGLVLLFVLLGVALYMLMRQQRIARGFEGAVSTMATLGLLAVLYTNAAPVRTVVDVFRDQFGLVADGLLLATGVVCGLVYFFFSKEHKGFVFGGCSRIGIWFLMVSFGASFGYTVMGRVSLLIGRIDFLLRLPNMTQILLQ